MTTDRPADNALFRYVPLAIVLLVSAMLLPMLLPLRVLWIDLQDAGYGHGPLLAVLVAWLVVRASSRADHPRLGSRLALVALAAASIVWAAAAVSSTTSVAQALWPLMSWLVLAAVYGWRSARRFALPLFLLYFALPVWGPLTNLVLWPLTIKASTVGIQLLGLNAYVDRNFVHVPAGAFEIISGCSGQHFLLVATVIGLLIAYLNELRGRQFALVVGVAIAMALVMNWVRVTAIIAIGYYSNMQHPLVAEGHLLFGWILFAAVLVTYILWARYYLARLPAIDARPRAHAAPSAGALPPAGVGMLFAALLCAVIGPSWYAAVRNRIDGAASEPATLRLPVSPPGWIGPLVGTSPTKPQFPGVTVERRAVYTPLDEALRPVHVYANLYLAQRQGAELVGYANVVLPAADWRLATVQPVAGAGSGSGVGALAPDFREYTAATTGGERWLLRQTYAIAGRLVASDWESKVVLAIDALLLRAPRAGLVLLAIPCESDCGAVAATMAQAWSAIVPGLQESYR